MILIPAIDLKEGHCVRLRQGNMDESTVFSDDPVAMAGKWVDQGCRRLHLVDLDGAFQGQPINADVVEEISASFPDLEIQIGGGIRSIETVEAYLEAGVNFVIIGTMAVKRPEFVTQLCSEFSGNVIVGIDARNGIVATHGWAEESEHSARDLARRFEDQGVVAIVYTDISRDGMMQGVNVEATKALAESINVPARSDHRDINRLGRGYRYGLHHQAKRGEVIGD